MSILDAMVREDFEEILFCHDELAKLRGIIGIHNTTLGPAMGGLRVRPYESEAAALEDLLRMGKSMTLKASAAGLNLGGGYAVIICDPQKDKTEGMLRAFGRNVESLGGRFYVAEDVGSTVEDMETIAQETSFVAGIGKPRGGSGNPALKASFGVLRGIQACLGGVFGDPNLRGRTVAIQGVGAVGGELARLLVEEGARVLVADRDPRKIEKLKTLFHVEEVSCEKIHSVPCDVFSPCALGGTLTESVVDELKARIVAGSANNQLASEQVGNHLFARGIIYAPDFVVNAGGLINVAEELSGYDESTANHRIGKLFHSIDTILRISRERKIPTHVAAHEMALERIRLIRDVRRTFLPSQH